MNTLPKKFFQNISRDTKLYSKYFGTIHNHNVMVHDDDVYWGDSTYRIYASVTVDNLITISKFTAKMCSTNVIESLVAHEIGHIKLGHVDLLIEDIRVTSRSPIRHQDWELEADAYAATVIVNPKLMSTALSYSYITEVLRGGNPASDYMLDLSDRIDTLAKLTA